MNPTNPAGCQLERNNERRLGLFALSQKLEGRMGELDMDGRRRMEGRGRVAVSEGSRRQMREMVAVMGERESEGDGKRKRGCLQREMNMTF